MRLQENQHIGPWRLLSHLGSGGNGTVWRSRHDEGHIAALKVLQAKSRTSYQRFKHEIEIQRRYSDHPGVLSIIAAHIPDDQTDDDPAWLATPTARELTYALEGKEPEAIVGAVLSVADTLAELAGQGVSHRDIKPKNLFWLNNRPVLGDFGLADYPDKEAVTAPGQKLGPAYFIAPEMLTHSDTADGRKADVYSLAKVLWVLLAGQNYPPQGEVRIDIPQIVLSNQVTHPRIYLLDRLIERATRTDPAKRPRMAEFAAELRAWLAPKVETMKPDDLSDIVARIQAASEPLHRADEYQRGLIELAKEAEGRLETGFQPIAAVIADATGLDRQIVRSEAILDWSHIKEAQSLDSPDIIWSHGKCLIGATPGTQSLVLLSGVGVVLYENGQLHIEAAHLLNSAYHGKSVMPATPVWHNAWAAQVGSAEQEQDIMAALQGLSENVRPLLEAFASNIEEIRR